jgi:hypothetical protein
MFYAFWSVVVLIFLLFFRELFPDKSSHPFGAEGPVAGVWHYQSKVHYELFNLLISIVLGYALYYSWRSFNEGRRSRAFLLLGSAVFTLLLVSLIIQHFAGWPS